MSPEQENEYKKNVLFEYEEVARQEKILLAQMKDFHDKLRRAIDNLPVGVSQADYDALSSVPPMLPVLADYIQNNKRLIELRQRKKDLGY